MTISLEKRPMKEELPYPRRRKAKNLPPLDLDPLTEFIWIKKHRSIEQRENNSPQQEVKFWDNIQGMVYLYPFIDHFSAYIPSTTMSASSSPKRATVFRLRSYVSRLFENGIRSDSRLHLPEEVNSFLLIRSHILF